MTEPRKAILSPFGIVAIEAMGEAANVPMLRQHLPRVDVRNIIYTYLFQAGVDEFELASTNEKDNPTADFLKRRTKLHMGREWVDSFIVVNETFSTCLGTLGTNENWGPEYKRENFVGRFLTDLLYALSRKTSLVVADVPDAATLKSLRLPLELLMPIRNLIGSFEVIKPELLIAKSVVTAGDIARFEEILASSVFGEYVEGHRQLDRNAEKPAELQKYIQEAAHRVQKRNQKNLRLRKVPVAVLPTTARIVDVIFGGLPGKLAELGASLFSKWIAEERRLAVYELGIPREQVIRGRIEEYRRHVQGKAPDDIQ